MHLVFHPDSNLLPLMEGVAFECLVDDIRLNGQREPILITADGQIIDGRNRYRACVQLGILPFTKLWDGIGEVVSLVLSFNLHRRHLSKTQRAVLGCEIALPSNSARYKKTRTKYGICNRRAHAAARACFVAHSYIYLALRIKRRRPELFDKMKAGQMTIAQAQHEMRVDREPLDPGNPPRIDVRLIDSATREIRRLRVAGRSLDEVMDAIKGIGLGMIQ
jgi:hypothetical protein